MTAGHLLTAALWLALVVCVVWSVRFDRAQRRPRIDPRPVNRRVPR